MNRIIEIKEELEKTISEYIIPFWLERSVDEKYGGYITSFDENGKFDGDDVKNIVTQSRMVWGFSHLVPYARFCDKEKMKSAAEEGMHFLIEKFWDPEFGGFYWLLNGDGTVKDSAKLTYGEGFAIYALSEYYLAYKDPVALEYACKGFDYLQKYATDTLYGGYFENIERDWTLSPAGAFAGDRKSLDIHMHLLEAYTTLYKASGEEIHGRKLNEVYQIILHHMVNIEKGFGYNQFDFSFNKIPAINILRTWNAERESNETIKVPTDTTSYGHNVELSWLGDLALSVLGKRTKSDDILLKKLLDHALSYGYDYDNGGVYRDGVADKQALIYDKEWWQNFEAMTGFLNGYVLFGDQKYFDAFAQTWEFDRKYFMNYQVGESRQLLNKEGKAIIANMGNPWKGIYHTGRAFGECIDRLNTIISKR